jgi:hypothetical protein
LAFSMGAVCALHMCSTGIWGELRGRAVQIVHTNGPRWIKNVKMGNFPFFHKSLSYLVHISRGRAQF